MAAEEYQVNWNCWHFSQEFFEALEKYGLPPTDLDYDKLMENLAELKEQKVQIENLQK